MVASFFDRITRLSLRFRWVVIILALLTLAAGVVSMTQLNLALLPSIEFPQTIVIVQWPESESVEQFLEEVTIPLEESLGNVESIVNVESTTSSGFAFVVTRNEFGAAPDRVLADIEAAIDSVSLPQGAEPEILNFSLDDLPVVSASVSSSELSLADLKTLVSNDLVPELEGLEQVSEATVSGGQELPDETAVDEPDEVVEEPEEPGRLPIIVREGAQTLGLDVEFIQDVTPEMLLDLEGTNQEVLDALALLPPELLPLAQPDSLAILPSEYIETLDPELQTELDELAAEFGGVGNYTLDEVRELEVEQIGVFPTATPEPTPEPTAEPTAAVEEPVEELPEVEPVALPESWIAASAQGGQELETTADITPEAMELIVSFVPELLNDLTPEMWRALDPAAAAIGIPAAEVLDPALVAQVKAIQLAANGETPGPVALPESWTAAAAQTGQTLETTADVTAESMELLVGFAPELLDDLTEEQILAFPPDVHAALPEDYVTGLDEELQATLAVIAIRAAQFEAAQEQSEEPEEEAAEVEPTPTPDPARLPEIMIQGAQSMGIELEYAYDITPDFMRQLSSFGPQALQILQLLTPDNLRAMQPEVIALLPAEYLDTLDADLRAELDELAAEFGGAGQLALEEAAEEEEAAVDAPPLSGIWLEPGPNGEDPLFQNAADILNNQFPLPGADVAPAAAFLNFLPESPQTENPAEFLSALSPEVIAYLAENEEPFVETLSPAALRLMSPESLTYLLDSYPDAFEPDLAEELRGIAAGEIEVFVPEASITRTDGNPSVLLNIFKDGDANTVVVAHRVFDALESYSEANPGISYNLVFEQATFIEDAIEGVSREGVLGAAFAVLVILVFLSGRVGGLYKLSWRATIVVGVSIPLSVFSAFLLMRWVPSLLGTPINNLANESGSGLLRFLAQLFPTDITLNIMTLSGLTVAIGRVVDDSIVVLENTYRFIQRGDDPVHAAIEGTREVAVAIFTSTVTTMAVFLPLGLLGGIIGSFFLPFGLTVTYALAASFVVSITVVPALAVLMIRKEHIPEEVETTMQKVYTPALQWALANQFLTLGLATLLFIGSLFLLFQLPLSFIPSLGEPTINVSAELPNGTTMQETDELVGQLEAALNNYENIDTVQAEIGGGGGFEALFGAGGNISQNVANLTITVEDQEGLNELTNEIRQEAAAIFGEENVTVSAAAQAGFSGFSLIVTGDSMEQLEPVIEDVKAAIASVDIDEDGVADIANVSSNVDEAAAGDSSIIRIDGRPAISFSGELETDNTLGVTSEAKQAVADLDNLPTGVEVTEGFDTQQQTEGFQDMVTAIGYSIVLVYLIMALSFRSLIHPFTILFSLPFALVGAALALFITSSVLGISSMIGLMMLVGVVVTNAIVLLELVQQLRNRGANAHEALVEGGRTRLRPIWMTALTAILALIPLALSQEAGAIIAGELARAVIGGLLVSTLLTLIVVPVVYTLLDPVNNFFRERFRRGTAESG
jgi:HAE1 family hydrophobic/amphiphilic exporter-1